MIVAGLTGNLGTGKTTVAQMFAQLGAAVIDADQVAKEALFHDPFCTHRVKRLFPEAVEQGKINPKTLADIVFHHPDRLSQLEGIVHPAVRRKVAARLRQLQKGGRIKVVILDAPLLFEAGWDDFADAVIVVKANQALQIRRVMKDRGMSRQDILTRLRVQMPQQEKMERADFVIDNRFSKAKTRAQVKSLWDGLVSV